jgi:membrane protein implicated in regulation of membrane protease activity
MPVEIIFGTGGRQAPSCSSFVVGARHVLLMGESALFVVGAIIWLFPGMDEEYQVMLFSVLSVISILAARRFLKRRPIESDRPSQSAHRAIHGPGLQPGVGHRQ